MTCDDANEESVKRIEDLAALLTLCLGEADSLGFSIVGIHVSNAVELVKEHLRDLRTANDA